MRTFAYVEDPTTLTDEERERYERPLYREITLDDEVDSTNTSSYKSNINNQRRNK